MNTDDISGTATQFISMFGALRTVSPQAALDPQVLSDGLGPQAADGTDEELARRVAARTPLTQDAALPIVQAALSANNNNVQPAAEQVSSQLAGLTGSAQLQLSQPLPLSAPWRTGFGIGMAVILIVALILTAVAHSTGSAEYVALGILGGLSWLGTVLFVMGYQSVNITGSSGSNSGAQQ
jgi:hypothetical protein